MTSNEPPISIEQLARVRTLVARSHTEFPPRQTRSDRTASPSFGGDRSKDQRIKEEVSESREKRGPLMVANAPLSSRRVSATRHRDRKSGRERSRTAAPAGD